MILERCGWIIPSERVQKYCSGVVSDTVNIKYLILFHERFREPDMKILLQLQLSFFAIVLRICYVSLPHTWWQ